MIFIGLGSNLGNRKQNLETALSQMKEKAILPLRCSSIYESKAWGLIDQNDFYNAVVEVEFDGPPDKLLDKLQEIEDDMGRVRSVKWGPRIIDLDIIEFHRRIERSERLVLPHPLYTQRGFVLYPLRELEPSWITTGEEESIDIWIQKLDEEAPKALGFTLCN